MYLLVIYNLLSVAHLPSRVCVSVFDPVHSFSFLLNTCVWFQVHKVVLASCSAYFRAMFTQGFKECSASEVTLRDVCPEVMGRLIDFAYTSRITMGEKCVLHLLLAAMR